jgi:hypothetical protein
LKKLSEDETWLYNVGSDSTLEEYSNRLNDVLTLCTPIERRYFQYTNLPKAISDIQNAIILAENFYIS